MFVKCSHFLAHHNAFFIHRLVGWLVGCASLFYSPAVGERCVTTTATFKTNNLFQALKFFAQIIWHRIEEKSI